MSSAVGTARAPTAFPLALSASLLAVSVVTAAVVGVVSPGAGLSSIETVGQWLGWFCGVGLLIAINAAMAATVVSRRGTPPRFAVALVSTMVTLYVATFLLSLARGWAVNAWISEQPGAARSIMAWMPFASLLQMLVVAVLSLALAWKVGGRGVMPVAWSTRARRTLGAIVAFGACIGLLPLQGRLMAMLDLVPLQALQLGLPFLAITLGLVHASVWAIAPARAGSGVWPAFVSAALVGPLLLLVAWLSQFILVRIGTPSLVGIAASTMLLACPLLAWAICRGAVHRRQRLQQQG